MPRALDLTNKRFGRLLPLKRMPSNPRSKWLCRCDCGVEKIVGTGCLTGGHTKSCGCLGEESHKWPKRHGLYVGGSPSPEMKIFNGIVARCENPKEPNYKYYGGRGICVSPEWRKDPRKFIADVGRRPSRLHSLDRIDVNLGYQPGNCKWVTQSEQSRNTRRNIMVDYEGSKITLTDFCKKTGENYGALRSYIKDKGMTLEDAISLHRKRKRIA